MWRPSLPMIIASSASRSLEKMILWQLWALVTYQYCSQFWGAGWHHRGRPKLMEICWKQLVLLVVSGFARYSDRSSSDRCRWFSRDCESLAPFWGYQEQVLRKKEEKLSLLKFLRHRRKSTTKTSVSANCSEFQRNLEIWILSGNICNRAVTELSTEPEAAGLIVELTKTHSWSITHWDSSKKSIHSDLMEITFEFHNYEFRWQIKF